VEVVASFVGLRRHVRVDNARIRVCQGLRSVIGNAWTPNWIIATAEAAIRLVRMERVVWTTPAWMRST
jgi:hypothetical protein